MESVDRGDVQNDNLVVWEETIKEIFPIAIPDNCIWEDIDSVILILNKLSFSEESHHILFPNGGGHNLIGAKSSSEKDCIELKTPNSIRVVKPKTLEFNSFPNNLDWAYFRLETGGLKPITPNIDPSFIKEKLTELTPGHYVGKEIWKKGYLGYDENNKRILLPKSARLISRYSKGSFVIFAQGSLYNKSHVTYDARHNKVNKKEFRKYIKKCIIKYSK